VGYSKKTMAFYAKGHGLFLGRKGVFAAAKVSAIKKPCCWAGLLHKSEFLNH